MPVLTPFVLRAALACVALLLVACGGGAPEATRSAVETRPDDACAVCGMYLDGSPGPRAEAWVAGRARPLVFDSTRDFCAYVLQPENQARLQELYVQDSARIDWDHPGHAVASFIDARGASYVIWQPLPGSMGPTLAPFATRPVAEAFAARHGGAVLGFSQVTPALVAALDYRCPGPAATGALRGLQCHAPPSAAGLPRAAGAFVLPGARPGRTLSRFQ